MITRPDASRRPPRRTMLGTIGKSDQVLRLFTTQHPEWGVSEVAKALGVPASSAHEVFSSLAEIGLLRRTEENRYRLGWRLVTMANAAVAGNGFARHGAPAVRRLAARLGQTSYLTVWDGDWPLVLTSTVPPGGIADPTMGRGTQIRGYTTASAKVLLAGMPEGEVEQHVATGGHQLRDSVRMSAADGFGTDLEDSLPGVCEIAVPVHVRGQVAAALGVAMRPAVFNARDHRQLLAEMASAAERLSC